MKLKKLSTHRFMCLLHDDPEAYTHVESVFIRWATCTSYVNRPYSLLCIACVVCHSLCSEAHVLNNTHYALKHMSFFACSASKIYTCVVKCILYKSLHYEECFKACVLSNICYALSNTKNKTSISFYNWSMERMSSFHFSHFNPQCKRPWHCLYFTFFRIIQYEKK